MSRALIFSGVLILLLIGSKYKAAFTVRGIRNHNPGNIRKGQNWLGSVGDDGAFIVFSSAEYGIRALGKLLLNYERLYGLDTVESIISRYAPSIENDTGSYIDSVASGLGVHAAESVDIGSVLPGLVRAIIRHENGVQPYSDELISRGLGLIEGYA